MKRSASQSLSKTPAPKKDRIKGSAVNKPRSASNKTSAKSIEFSEGVAKSIQNKVTAFNRDNPRNKVTLATAKAVVRRGMGAFSSSYRPTISGGAPNSRTAWGLARLNAFLKKKSGLPTKKAYIQDDDLL
jgi:hypothetical protein